MGVVQENVNIAKREAEMMKVTAREKDKMIAEARRDCENLDTQALQLDGALGSLSDVADALAEEHDAAKDKVAAAMEALRLAKEEEAAAAASAEAHQRKMSSVKKKLEDVNVRKAAASTKLRALTAPEGENGGMNVLQTAEEQAAIANGLSGLLESTRGLITAEAKGRQSTISSAANAVPGQLLGALARHLQNKTIQQHEVLERVIFCRKRLGPLETERAQLEAIGLNEELKVNQGTMQKLNNMLNEAFASSDEILQVAAVAKKTRDTHAASVDRTLVKNLDILIADIQVKHTTISLADATTVAGPAPNAPPSSAPPQQQPSSLAIPNGNGVASTLAMMANGGSNSGVAKGGKANGKSNRKANGAGAGDALAGNPVSAAAANAPVGAPVAAQANKNGNGNGFAAPRGWGTVKADAGENGKDGAEPTPAEAARRKTESFSLFS